jgi:hypothetical protein
MSFASSVMTLTTSVCSVACACITLYYLHKSKLLDPSIISTPNKASVKRRIVPLKGLPKDQVPMELRPSFYFQHSFKHDDIFEKAHHVFDVLDLLHAYCELWLASYVPDSMSSCVQLDKCCQGNGIVHILRPAADEHVLDTCQVLNYNESEVSRRLCLEEGIRIMGGVLDVTDGSIFIGKHVVIEPNVYIKGGNRLSIILSFMRISSCAHRI